MSELWKATVLEVILSELTQDTDNYMNRKISEMLGETNSTSKTIFNYLGKNYNTNLQITTVKTKLDPKYHSQMDGILKEIRNLDLENTYIRCYLKKVLNTSYCISDVKFILPDYIYKLLEDVVSPFVNGKTSEMLNKEEAQKINEHYAETLTKIKKRLILRVLRNN